MSTQPVLFYLESDASGISLERLFDTKARAGYIVGSEVIDKIEKYVVEYTWLGMTHTALVPSDLVMPANVRSWEEYLSEPFNPFSHSPLYVAGFGALLYGIYRLKTL